jgi:hypothetical protein
VAIALTPCLSLNEETLRMVGAELLREPDARDCCLPGNGPIWTPTIWIRAALRWRRPVLAYTHRGRLRLPPLLYFSRSQERTEPGGGRSWSRDCTSVFTPPNA